MLGHTKGNTDSVLGFNCRVNVTSRSECMALSRVSCLFFSFSVPRPLNPDSRPSAAVCRFGSSLAPRPLACPPLAGFRFPVPRSRFPLLLPSALVTPVPALLYGDRCPQVSGSLSPAPCSRFPVPCSRLSPQARVSPGFRFPVPGSPFPAFGSYPQRRMPICPCKNHQIRVKIDQKGDVFRQKGIKKARVSSCPS